MTCMPNVSCPISLFISTHILTKRMTQHTTLIYTPVVFQLTSSRRGWHWTFFNVTGISYFNSHPHEEDDVPTFWDVLPLDISTHILTKRMTPLIYPNLRYRHISTHILTKRMTSWLNEAEEELKFQLTSSRRGWQPQSLCHHIQAYFNSHPHEEDDVTNIQTIFRWLFQLTSSRRGWRHRELLTPKQLEFQLTSSRRGWRRIGYIQ